MLVDTELSALSSEGTWVANCSASDEVKKLILSSVLSMITGYFSNFTNNQAGLELANPSSKCAEAQGIPIVPIRLTCVVVLVKKELMSAGQIFTRLSFKFGRLSKIFDTRSPISTISLFLKPPNQRGLHFFLGYAEEFLKGKNRMLTVREHVLQDTKVLELSGRFDSQSKVGIEIAILGAQEIGCHHIILNFSNITWIDSVGLGQMFLWYHRLKPERIRLSIVSPQSQVRELLELANLPQVVPVYQSEEEAVAAKRRGFPSQPF